VAKSNVNLDALIVRQDMAAGGDKPVKVITSIKHTELEKNANTYNVLRKPDFQRETSSWTPEKVRDLIVAYAKEDFIPAIILWRSPSNDLFVIDGAHRLSCLIAWVNNDYGDGDISRSVFDEILESQKQVAQKTRSLVDDTVGPYSVISAALAPGKSVAEKYIQVAKVLVSCSITVQNLPTTDVAVAERSFFKIDEQGVPLTETEIQLLHSRNCPNAIAARAINQRGTGHSHWQKFKVENRKEIEKLSQEIYSHCFNPPLEGSTVKTSVQPICGAAATGLGLLLNTIDIANKLEIEVPKNREQAEASIGVDKDGDRTIEFLRKTKNLVTAISNRTTTDFMRSLDLHPLVYFYSTSGRHLPSAFLAVLKFVRSYIEKDQLMDFTKIRPVFEDFLVEHKDFFSQIVLKTRGEMKAVRRIEKFFQLVAEQCEKNVPGAQIVEFLQACADFDFLKLPSAIDKPKPSKDFSPAVKSKIVIQEKLENAVRCSICNARVPGQGISFDHIQDKSEGGMGSEENAAKTHHYCNSAKKVLIPFLAAERTRIGLASA
jgi:hypothetical protein